MFNLFKKKESREITLISRIEEIEKELFEEIEESPNYSLSGLRFYPSYNWNKKTTIRKEIKYIKRDFNELDKKFDALCEFLKVEFVDEKLKLSDGSDTADRSSERYFARIKKPVNKSKVKKEEDNDWSD